MSPLNKRDADKQTGVAHATITIGDDARANDIAAAHASGHARDPRNQKIFACGVILVALYAFALVVPKNILPTVLNQAESGYTISWFILSLQDNLNGIMGVFTGSSTGPVSYESTVIRYIMICFTGAGMALCGAVYQGSFRNALVSPSTLGIMSGATLGLTVYVIFFYDSLSTEFVGSLGLGSNGALSAQASIQTDVLGHIFSSYGLAICSFAGCMFIMALVLLVLRLSRGTASAIFLIITGQVMGGVVGAVCESARYYYMTVDQYGDKATLLTELMISSFYRNYTWVDLACVGVPLIVTFLVVMHLRSSMMTLSLDEGEQRTLGVESRRMMYAVLALCTLLTAMIVSFCGTIGFVGFLVPHLARRLVGPNFKYLIPASAVLGAVFVLAAYTLLMITLGSDYETMVGMFISIGGAAVFLVTALRGKGGVRGQFK